MREHRKMRSPTRTKLARFGDAAIPWAVGLFLVMIVMDEGGSAAAVLAGLICAVGQGAALRWRRSRPELVMVVTLIGGLGLQLLIPTIVVPFAALFAVASLAAARRPQVSLLGLAGLEALSAANFFTTTVEDSLFTMGLAVGAWALGEAARNRDAAITQETRRAVGEEQARIARELHDVIAHSVSVIVVQAGAADDVFDTRPDQAREALRSIEQVGRDALGELRRLLGAVQPAGAVTEPQPGLDRLDELAEPLRAAGLSVVVRREGAAPPLPAGVELSAYRIVQEALTNTLRHAHASSATVTIRHESDAIEVDVRDDGTAAQGGGGSGGGRGLVGMRERATLLGGTLEAGPVSGGGYRVHAHLPLEAAT